MFFKSLFATGKYSIQSPDYQHNVKQPSDPAILDQNTRIAIPPLQTDTNAVSTSILRITDIRRVVIAPKPLGALLADESTTRGGLFGSADAGRVTGHAAGAGNARIVDAVRALLAGRRGLLAEAAACLVLVLEVTGARAAVEVGAAIVVGHALCVSRAGGNLEAAASAIGALLGGCEAEESGSDEVGEEHCD